MVSARGYFKLYEQQTVNGPAITTVVQRPKHGVLRLVTEADGSRFGEGRFVAANQQHVYLPESGYVGKDTATILVDFGDGNKVKVQYYFQAIDEPILVDSWMEDYCSEKGPYWKISSNLEIIGGTPRFLIALSYPHISCMMAKPEKIFHAEARGRGEKRGTSLILLRSSAAPCEVLWVSVLPD